MNEHPTIPAIEMRGVNVAAMRDATFTVVKEVNWSVAAGEFWIVSGQEHSGKSDLLMLAAGLMSPASGSYALFGCDTREFGEGEMAERLRVGFVFQGGHLFNQLTIAENVALPLRYQKNFEPAGAFDAVRALLELTELTPLADVTPANVAANWRQRAALARALILQPELLLLDNPLAGLGARHRQWWLRFLDQWSGAHAGRSTRPADSAGRPAARSSPARRRLSPPRTTLGGITTAPPSSLTNSWGTTVSRPDGITAPVVMRRQCPVATSPAKGWPARPVPTSVSRVGASAARSLPRSA